MLSTTRFVRFLLALVCGTALVGHLGSAPPEPKVVVQEREKQFRSSQSCNGFALSSDGRTFAVGEGRADGKCAVSLRDVKTHEEVRAFHGLAGKVWCLALDPMGKHVAASNGEAVQLWAVGAKGNGDEIPCLRKVDYRLVFSPNGQFLAGIVVRAEKRTAVVWDVVNRKELKLPEVAGNLAALVFSPDSKYLVLGMKNQDSKTWARSGGLTVVTLDEPKVHKSITFDNYGTDALTYAPDGKTLALGRNTWVPPPLHTFDAGVLKGQLQVWDTATWKVRVESDTQAPGIDAVAYSPDGAMLAYSSGPVSNFGSFRGLTFYYTGAIVEPEKLKVLQLLPEHWLFRTLAFSRGEKLLVTADGDNLRFWDYTVKP